MLREVGSRFLRRSRLCSLDDVAVGGPAVPSFIGPVCRRLTRRVVVPGPHPSAEERGTDVLHGWERGGRLSGDGGGGRVSQQRQPLMGLMFYSNSAPTRNDHA